MERQDGPLFEPLDVSLDLLDNVFRIVGNEMSVESDCSSLADLHQLVSAIFHIFPSVLNLYILDSPVVTKVTGDVAGQKFEWIYDPTEIRGSIWTTSKEGQEQIVADSWRYMELFDRGSNRRLMASLHYFHIACRLLEAGVNRFEFLSEAILNFSKSLQAIFGESLDDVRNEIGKLKKYPDHEIETRFVTALILRSYFDVAHVSLSIFNKEQLRTLHNYCRIAEESIREVIQTVIKAIEDGTYRPKKDTSATLSIDKAKKLKVIQDNLDRVDPDP